MRRVRCVEAELWGRREFLAASAVARELWLAAICVLADDEGRFVRDTVHIALRVFGGRVTAAEVEEALRYWEECGWLLRYGGDGLYCYLRGWFEHQWLRYPQPSSLPPPPVPVASWRDLRALREYFRAGPRVHSSRLVREYEAMLAAGEAPPMAEIRRAVSLETQIRGGYTPRAERQEGGADEESDEESDEDLQQNFTTKNYSKNCSNILQQSFTTKNSDKNSDNNLQQSFAVKNCSKVLQQSFDAEKEEIRNKKKEKEKENNFNSLSLGVSNTGGGVEGGGEAAGSTGGDVFSEEGVEGVAGRVAPLVAEAEGVGGVSGVGAVQAAEGAVWDDIARSEQPALLGTVPRLLDALTELYRDLWGIVRVNAFVARVALALREPGCSIGEEELVAALRDGIYPRPGEQAAWWVARVQRQREERIRQGRRRGVPPSRDIWRVVGQQEEQAEPPPQA